MIPPLTLPRVKIQITYTEGGYWHELLLTARELHTLLYTGRDTLNRQVFAAAFKIGKQLVIYDILLAYKYRDLNPWRFTE